MNQAASILRALVTDGRWRRSLALVVLFALGCAGLSWWQFARRTEAAGINRQVQRSWNAPARPLADVLPARTAWRPAAEWTPVRLVGVYETSSQLLVRNRTQDGNPGFEVLVPLRLEDGSVFVVDRGWVSIGRNQDRPDAVPEPPAGRVTVVARLRPSEASRPGQPPAGEVQSIDLPGIAARLGGPVWTGAYGLLRSESPPAATTPAPYPEPSVDEGMHLSYALQWIFFAVVGFGLLGWSIRRDLRDAGDEAVLAADQRLAERRARRAPSDESAEDALLDR
jgi:cytochrome oxidase assembly protein ShyY1